MQIYLGADHGGFEAKNAAIVLLQAAGYVVKDLGAHIYDETDDYPEFAAAVARAVAADPEGRGLLFCRSGEGMAMAANRFRGVRAALVWNEEVARETRSDNDANVAVLPADFLPAGEQHAVIETFLQTPFSREERHQRRVRELDNLP